MLTADVVEGAASLVGVACAGFFGVSWVLRALARLYSVGSGES